MSREGEQSREDTHVSFVTFSSVIPLHEYFHDDVTICNEETKDHLISIIQERPALCDSVRQTTVCTCAVQYLVVQLMPPADMETYFLSSKSRP